jgi:hypothetical protein
LAKVYLYQKKWQLAVDECNKVTGYSLTPIFRIFIKFQEKIMLNLSLKLMEGRNCRKSYSAIQPGTGCKRYYRLGLGICNSYPRII